MRSIEITMQIICPHCNGKFEFTLFKNKQNIQCEHCTKTFEYELLLAGKARRGHVFTTKKGRGE